MEIVSQLVVIASQLVVIGQSASSDGQLVVIASQPASSDNLKLVVSRSTLENINKLSGMLCAPINVQRSCGGFERFTKHHLLNKFVVMLKSGVGE